jgi:serine/threonine protein kinase
MSNVKDMRIFAAE